MKIRKKIIAGNWKMNKTVSDAQELASSVKLELADCREVDVVLCPPFTALKAVGDIILGQRMLQFTEDAINRFCITIDNRIRVGQRRIQPCSRQKTEVEHTLGIKRPQRIRLRVVETEVCQAGITADLYRQVMPKRTLFPAALHAATDPFNVSRHVKLPHLAQGGQRRNGADTFRPIGAA